MANAQNQRGGAVVDNRGGFGLAKDSERAFEISSAVAAVSGRQVELYIIIGRSDVAEYFSRALSQGRATEICVNDNARAINHWLNTAGAQFLNSGADKTDNRGGIGDFAPPSNLC
jgi:hypothetical protein